MALMSAEECYKALVSKSHQQYSDLAKVRPKPRKLRSILALVAVFSQMFTTVDNKSKSVIRRNDLRELLFKFMLPIGKEEFAKLWAM